MTTTRRAAAAAAKAANTVASKTEKVQSAKKKTSKAKDGASKTASVKSGSETQGKFATQVSKASSALLAHHQQRSLSAKETTEKMDLFEDQKADSVYLTVGIKIMRSGVSLKPIALSVPHPWNKSDASGTKDLRVCLITRDSTRKDINYSDAISALGIASITKILPLTDLVKKFKTFESKRLLNSSFDVFLADSCVIHLLPSLLGKKIYDSKKHPIPVTINDAHLLAQKTDSIRQELVKAIESTQLLLTSGACISIRVGLTTQSSEEISANVQAVVRQLTDKLPDGGLSNVKCLHLKTNSSIALPIYQATSI